MQKNILLESRIYPSIRITDRPFCMSLVDVYSDHESHQVYRKEEHQDWHRYVLQLNAKRINSRSTTTKSNIFTYHYIEFGVDIT